MEFFRLRPQAVFGTAFFVCSLLISYCDFDCTLSAAAAVILFLCVLTAALIKWRSADVDAKQTLAALLSLFLAPVLALGLFAYRDGTAPLLPDGGAEVIAVVRTRLASSGGYGQYILDVCSLNGAETDFVSAASTYGLSLDVGDVIEASADVTAVSSHCRGDERYLRSRGAVAEMELSAVRRVGRERSAATIIGALREKIGSQLRLCVGENAPLVTALVTGERAGLDGTLRRSFSDIGIPHLLAISGLHLNAVTACVSFAARGLRRRKYFVTVPMILLYAAISGFSASVVRAGTMALVLCFAELIGRRGDTVSVISLAVTAIVLVSPGAVYDVGFLLSVLCVFALAVLSYLKNTKHAAWNRHADRLAVPDKRTVRKRRALSEVKRIRQTLLGRVLRTAALSVTATLMITIVTLPVTVREFGTLSLIAPIANLVFIPLFSLLICAAPVFVAVSFVPFLGAAAGRVIGFYAGLLTRLVIWADSVGGDLCVSLDYPFFGTLSVLLSLSLVLSCISERRRRFAVLSGVLVCSMIASAAVTQSSRAGIVNVTFRAGTQGDLIFVADGPELYVIDSARPVSSVRRRIEEGMRSEYATHIGAYVFTHYHTRSDVYLRQLLSGISVDEVILPMPQSDDERGFCMDMVQIALGAGCVPKLIEDSITLGSVVLDRSWNCQLAGSSESVFALSLSVGGESVTYISAGYFDANEAFMEENNALLSDNIIIGSHGIKNPSAPVFVSLPTNLTTLTDGKSVSVTWKKPASTG